MFSLIFLSTIVYYASAQPGSAQEVCGQNQVWYPCVPCDTNCVNGLLQLPPNCNLACRPGCGCLLGFGRLNGQCISATDCSTQSKGTGVGVPGILNTGTNNGQFPLGAGTIQQPNVVNPIIQPGVNQPVGK